MKDAGCVATGSAIVCVMKSSGAPLATPPTHHSINLDELLLPTASVPWL